MNKRIGRRQLKEKIRALNIKAADQAKEIGALTDKSREIREQLDRLSKSPDIVPYIEPITVVAAHNVPDEWGWDINDIKEMLVQDLVELLMNSDHVQFVDDVSGKGTKQYIAKLYVIPWPKALYNRSLFEKERMRTMTLVGRVTQESR